MYISEKGASNDAIAVAIGKEEKLIAETRAAIRKLDDQVLKARGIIAQSEKTLVHLRAAQTTNSGRIVLAQTTNLGKTVLATPPRPALSGGRAWKPTRRSKMHEPAKRSKTVRVVAADREPGAWQRDIVNLMHTNDAPTTQKDLVTRLMAQNPKFGYSRAYAAVQYAKAKGTLLETANGHVAIAVPQTVA